MQAQKCSRIDIVELKALMLKKIGPERFQRYFFYLNRFINRKLSKSEFDKSCYRLLGRENLPLHNQIIRAILKNACNAKSPPTFHEGSPTKIAVAGARSLPVIDEVHGQGGDAAHNQSSNVPVWPNGVVLPLSPRKGRSAIRDRKLRDRPSPLGPNGRADSASHQSTATEESGAKHLENGELNPCDFRRLLQQPQELAEQPENEDGMRMKKPLEVPNNLLVVEDGEEVEQASHLKFSRSTLLAPLGIPFCPASIGGAGKALPVRSTSDFISCYDSGELLDSETLRKRMEQISAAQGLGGVTMECANILNNMLDVYLKRLIKSCVGLVGARSENDPSKHPVQKQQIRNKLMNGLLPINHLHSQSGGIMEERRESHSISLLDFKVAMELNPQQLGEDWPLLLEKISMQAFDEKDS